MWNVGTDPVLNDYSIIDKTNSYRKWKKDEVTTNTATLAGF